MSPPVLSNSVYLAAVIAHVPLFVGYVRVNWTKGHYQFFPLLIAVAGWLIYDRLLDLKKRRRPSTSTSASANDRRSIHFGRMVTDANSLASVMALLLGAAVLGFATLAQSSFLVVPSIMLLTAAWILDRYGIKGFKAALPAWLLLLLAIPFPWNLDSVLVHRMQFMASGLASWILDSLGQIHFRDGLTLITAKKQFFTEEACSGIRSLFSSLAAISAYGVANRFPLWRYVFNWLQVILWVVIGNAIRVAVVVYVSDNWSEAIGTGGWHDLLGVGVFVLIMALALSTNRAIDAFRPDVNELEDDDLLFSPTIDGVVASPKLTPEPASPRSRRAQFANWAGLVFFGLVFLFSVRLVYAQYAYQPVAFNDGDLIELKATDIPAVIDDWQVVDFDRKLRPKTSLLAPDSFLWTLQKGSRKCVVSLDGPYDTFHDLSACYLGLGWNIETAYDRQPEGVDQSDRCYFSAHDGEAEP